MKHDRPIKIGISACLAGDPVRYDGGHTCVAGLCDYLSSLFTLVPVCPEVETGMGVPRAPIQLVGESITARALGVKDKSLDVTDRLSAYAMQILQTPPALDGFVVKARSPSCGLDSTPLYDNKDQQTGTTSGIFTRTIRATNSAIPLIDESCISNRVKMDLFALQVCVYSAFRQQVLLAEDKQTALSLFRKNLATIAAMKITPHLVLPTQLPLSMNPEEFIKQYMGRLREQPSDEDPVTKQLIQMTGSDAACFNVQRVTELLEKRV